MTEVCLLCLIGIPASGKTTLSRELKYHLENDQDYNFNVVTVCFDGLDDFNNAPSGWKLKRKEIYEGVVKIIEEAKIKKYNNVSTIIVLDDNMYYRSMRYEYVKLAKSYSIGFCQIYLESDLSSALTLNQKRSNPVPNNIIKNIFEKIESPCPDKFSWEIKSLNLRCCSIFSDFIEPIKYLIFSALKDPFKHFVDEIRIDKPPQSQIHLADLAIRRIVTDKIKQVISISNDKDDLAKVSSTLTWEKQNILTAIKSGQIMLPDSEKMKEMSDEEKIKKYYQFFSTFLFNIL